MKTLRILGTRGVPAAHGGFETFAEHLALFLVGRGWRVVVYCQIDGNGPITEDRWRGVERVNIPAAGTGSMASIAFDWTATRHAARHRDLCLTLGYNTAVFCAWLRLRGVPNIINMDGIEWSRAKWGPLAKAWFWANDWAGCWLGNHLVADHPEIAAHLRTRVSASKITTIAYGADQLQGMPDAPVRALGLEPGRYLTLVARAEPENSILEVVTGFSAKPRGMVLAVLGNYSDANPYHRAVKAAASNEVRFLGAIYDKPVVQALRAHCAAYVHGHQVGGTNPSLVEALGAGNAVIAHDNKFNRWVCGEKTQFFSDAQSLSGALDIALGNDFAQSAMRTSSRSRFEDGLTWGRVLADYEKLCEGFLA
jgi:glycosyltransferase involved in cell wall biosynthesis